jgi:Short C-terminal domain
LNRISGIKLKERGLWMGYIQFILPGNIETTRESINGIQNDENTVTFGLCPFNRSKYNDLTKKIKLEIENRITNYSQLVINSDSDGPDTIRKYRQLCDDGIITKEEYEAKKKEILGF